MTMITQVPHDPAWTHRFDAEHVRLQSALAGRHIAVEHIGSTSVPGPAAKPIVDIMVGLPSMNDADHVATLLGHHGYTLRPVWLSARRLLTYRHSGMAYNVHLFKAGGLLWRGHLAFRDRLRADHALAAAYATLKAHAVDEFPNAPRRYGASKSPFIDTVVAHALRTPAAHLDIGLLPRYAGVPADAALGAGYDDGGGRVTRPPLPSDPLPEDPRDNAPTEDVLYQQLERQAQEAFDRYKASDDAYWDCMNGPSHGTDCHDAYERVTQDGNDLVDALNRRNEYRPLVASYY
jgi:GrpB-like predicted nucleotidyltransferase (UPF0157 family)